MLLSCLTGRELCYWFTWIVRRALNALTDRNKTKILIFFASFVKKQKTKQQQKKTQQNKTKNKQTNKQKKLQRITAVKHYFKKTKSWHFLYKRIEHQFLEFPIRAERLFRIQPRYTLLLCYLELITFLAEVLGEKAAWWKWFQLKLMTTFSQFFSFCFNFFLLI